MAVKMPRMKSPAREAAGKNTAIRVANKKQAKKLARQTARQRKAC